VNDQKQPGLRYVGVACPVGRLISDRLRGLADIAERFGSGTIRLTVWQNCLISDIPEAKLNDVLAAIEAIGLDWRASPIRGGLVACTGNAGCKFSASNTKRDAAMLADYLERHITIDHAINIHITGCHHSCAQHYAADIGLLATKIEQDDDMVEGYDLLIGGGAGPDQRLGRLVRPKVITGDLPPMILALLTAWQSERAGPGETFQAFTARHTEAELDALAGRQPVEA
jgi:ferredoxin-nitrite reductase